MNAYSQNWAVNGVVWGLHYNDGNHVSYLGETAFRHRDPKDLFLAKFLDSYGHNDWHGYPADHFHNAPHDIPPVSLLRTWLKNGVLPKTVISRLIKGQACYL